jgi:hypothetical protein
MREAIANLWELHAAGAVVAVTIRKRPKRAASTLAFRPDRPVTVEYPLVFRAIK